MPTGDWFLALTPPWTGGRAQSFTSPPAQFDALPGGVLLKPAPAPFIRPGLPVGLPPDRA